MKEVSGGITAPKGFLANAVKAGIKRGSDRLDLALIYSEMPASAAACYTRNKVKGQPILVTMESLADGRARAVIVNSGNANTCTGEQGLADAKAMARFAADACGLEATEVIVASTGVIGQRINIEAIEKAIPALKTGLSREGGALARDAIMTTDTVPKEAAVEFELGGKKVRIGAIAKGSGMIHPDMATMLCFVATDCAIEPAPLQAALSDCVRKSFNRVSVDGDTSTNDMVSVIANGAAGNASIQGPSPEYETFKAGLLYVLVKLAKMVAADGEGATKLLECVVSGAENEDQAEALAKSVISSSLVKAAFFGEDANWGRVLCAMGYAGVPFDPGKVDLAFASKGGRVELCAKGAVLPFDEGLASKVLAEKEIRIEAELGMGSAEATAWGCDLTYDYVKINGDYRT